MIHTYFIESGGFVKIGKTNNLKQRISTISVGNPTYRMLFAIGADYEKLYHRKFEEKRHRGEWFKLNLMDCYEVYDAHKSELIVDNFISNNSKFDFEQYFKDFGFSDLSLSDEDNFLVGIDLEILKFQKGSNGITHALISIADERGFYSRVYGCLS